MPDPFDFLLQQPNQNAQSQQLAAALRQLQQQQTLGQLGTLAGKTPVGQMGADVASQATQGQQLLAQIAQQRATQALTERERATQERAEAQKEKYQGEELRQRWAQIQQGKFAVNPATGELYNTRTGQPATGTQTPRPDEGYGPLGGGMARRADMLTQKLSDELDPVRQRGGTKDFYTTINRAAKLRAAITDQTTGQPKAMLTPQDMDEATIALQQMVAQGHASEREVEMLKQKGIGKDLAGLKQYWTGKPQDTGLQAWASRMLDIADREAKVSKDTINDITLKRIPGPLGGLNRIAPARGKSVLKSHGFNPDAFDANGLPIPGADIFAPEVKTSASSGAMAGAKPKTVKQNGVTYTLNEQTGQYE